MITPHRRVISSSLPFAILALAVATAACGSYLFTDAVAPEPRASVLQVGQAPIAVIDDLPESVSNGSTFLPLIGYGSYDPDGNITSYLWEVEHGDAVVYLDGVNESYQAESTGLYTIKLTVTDDDDNTGVDFAAVYAVLDIDDDDIPDWWEIKYFDDLSLTGGSDPDGDGHSNMEEFADNTDPTAADPDEDILEHHWRELVFAAVVIAVASILLVYLRYRRGRKESEHRKMEYAIEIQKALEEE